MSRGRRPSQIGTDVSRHIGAAEPSGKHDGCAPTLCEHCKRKHPGECWRVTGACFQCGSQDHIYKDCPKRKNTHVSQAERSATARSSNLITD
ncbi:hypothetical protein ACOSQ4_022598 [Xanthoceras sorbifolium]